VRLRQQYTCDAVVVVVVVHPAVMTLLLLCNTENLIKSSKLFMHQHDGCLLHGRGGISRSSMRLRNTRDPGLSLQADTRARKHVDTSTVTGNAYTNQYRTTGDWKLGKPYGNLSSNAFRYSTAREPWEELLGICMP
jgi:hypothetical protein